LSHDRYSKKQRQHGYAARQDLSQMFHGTLQSFVLTAALSL
jgi:hypothetical protein